MLFPHSDVDKEYEEMGRRFSELSFELASLNCEMQVQLQLIEDKSGFYRTCTSAAATWTPASRCTCPPGATEPTCTARREAYLEADR